MKKSDAIQLAKDSSQKLGVDADLLELMAIKIWEAAIDLSVSQLDEFERRSMINLIGQRSEVLILIKTSIRSAKEIVSDLK